jgi:hypothetical protein
MKIRCDFVTNSSSSSFVIGKKDDTSATIESVYQTIKGFYKELLKRRDEAIIYIAEHPELKMAYVQKDGYTKFECTETDFKTRWQLQDDFEEACGISAWSYFDAYDWLDCETYAEYEQYWLDQKKANPNDHHVYAPFTIADFLEEREIEWLHFNIDEEYDTRIHKVNSKSEVLNWYFPYADEAFQYAGNCAECGYAEWCDKEECVDTREDILSSNIPEDKACLYMMGRVCIHSESGYIPDYVVEKLCEISEYSCNHMG